MKTQPLDEALMSRYRECCWAHPNALLSPIQHPLKNFDVTEILGGRMVHVMVARGPFLSVQWVPVTPSIKFIMDAYAQ